jgi:N-acetylmuramoyl-L-alanine amidase
LPAFVSVSTGVSGMWFAIAPCASARLATGLLRPLATAAGLSLLLTAQTAEAQYWPFKPASAAEPSGSTPTQATAPTAEDAVLDAPAMLGVKPKTSVASSDATALAGDTTRTRFVIGLERAAEFQVFSLQNPNRVIVELPDLKLQLPQISGSAPVGLVQSFRGGQSAPGKTRIVIDVTGPVVVEKASIERAKDSAHSPRLVLEIVPVDATKPGQAAGKKAIVSGASGLGAGGLQPPAQA